MAQILVPKDQNRGNPNVVVSVFPASKGLYTSRSPILLPPEYSTSDTNCFIGFAGTKETRPGIEPYSTANLGNSSDFGVQFLMEHWRLNTSNSTKEIKNIAVTNNAVWADNGAGQFVNIGNPTTTGKAISGDVLVGLGVIGVEDSGLYTYNHSAGLNHLSAEPNAWIVLQHRGSLYAAGNASFPDVLYKSDVESTSFTGGAAETFNLDLGNQDSSGITGLAEFYGRLYVGKNTAIYEIQTDVTGAPVRLVSKTIGFISHNGIQNIGKDVLFPSIRGLHSLATTDKYGDIEQSYVSAPVSDIWTNTLDLDRAQLISSAFIPEYNAYLMLYPVKGGSSFNLLGYNVSTGDFYLWPEYPATFISRHICPVEKCFRLLVGDSQGRIGRGRKISDSTYLDFTDSYTTSFTAPPVSPAGYPGESYEFRNLKLVFIPKSGVITITYKIDNSADRVVTIDQSLYSSTAEAVHKTVPLRGIGSTLSLTFTVTPDSSKESASMEIVGYNIECASKGDVYASVQINN